MPALADAGQLQLRRLAGRDERSPALRVLAAGCSLVRPSSPRPAVALIGAVPSGRLAGPGPASLFRTNGKSCGQGPRCAVRQRITTRFITVQRAATPYAVLQPSAPPQRSAIILKRRELRSLDVKEALGSLICARVPSHSSARIVLLARIARCRTSVLCAQTTGHADGAADKCLAVDRRRHHRWRHDGGGSTQDERRCR